VARRLTALTLDNLSDLPSRCRSCVYWELHPVAREDAERNGDTELEKEAWLSDTLLEWGTCGQVVYVDDLPAGYVLYAPPAYVPRAGAFATSPAAGDAMLLVTAHIVPEFRGAGLGRVLGQAVARDVVRRGIRAVEAFGREDRAGTEMAGETRDDQPEERAATELGCLLPAGYLRSVGFKTVRPHPRTPRLRLDVKSTATWREDVESAVERLLSGIQSPVLSR
jgi:GNAT superfamily N-acetyltransferase